LPTVNAFWVGPQLGPVHAACLRSFVRAGHETVLHVYETPTDTPKEVKVADARAVLPQKRAVNYEKSGSHALAANLFRYQLLRHGRGLYVDCDVYCVRPIEDADYIYGWQDPQTICNAVLKLPKDSPVLAELCKLRDGFVPPWFTTKEQRKLQLSKLLGLPTRLSKLPWGTTGPKALTWYSKQLGHAWRASPVDVFYPVAMQHIHLLLDPEIRLEDLITPRTLAVHLWNKKFLKKTLGQLVNGSDLDLPPKCPLSQMLAD